MRGEIQLLEVRFTILHYLTFIDFNCVYVPMWMGLAWSSNWVPALGMVTGGYVITLLMANLPS